MAEPDSSPAVAFVAHSVPHRTRLRIPHRRHQPAYFAQLAERLLAHPLVREVVVNAVTGSVLIRHDDVIEAIADELPDLLEIVSRPAGPPPRHGAHHPGKTLPVNALQLAAMGCVTLSAYQLRRGNILGTASEHLWHAYNAWQNLQAPGIAAALLGGGLVQLARGQALSPAVSLLVYAMILRNAGNRGA
jgi:hypothetical protein